MQINPIWLWGPYHTWLGDERRAAGLVSRLADRRAAARAGLRRRDRQLHARAEPVLGRGAASRLIVIGFLYLWPWLERKVTGDHEFHNLLDRPRDAPWRTAIGVAMVTWVLLVFVAGSSDRVDVLFGLPYVGQIWFYRVARLRRAGSHGPRRLPRLPGADSGRARRGRPASRRRRSAPRADESRDLAAKSWDLVRTRSQLLAVRRRGGRVPRLQSGLVALILAPAAKIGTWFEPGPVCGSL